MPKFKLTGHNAGATVLINNRYDFVDGELTVSNHDAALIAPILCGYHGCVLEDTDEVEETKEPASTSLGKTVTNPGAQAKASTDLDPDAQAKLAAGNQSAASSAAKASAASKASKASTQAE